MMPGRWLRTGDFGRLEGGLLFISTRMRDLIIRGGENIYPREVEEFLSTHPNPENRIRRIQETIATSQRDCSPR